MYSPRPWFFRTTFPWRRRSSTDSNDATLPGRLAGAVCRYRGWRVTFSAPAVWLDLAALRRVGYPNTVLGRH